MFTWSNFQPVERVGELSLKNQKSLPLVLCMFILCTVCQDADQSGPPMPPATTCVPGVLALRQWAATLPPPRSRGVCRQI